MDVLQLGDDNTFEADLEEQHRLKQLHSHGYYAGKDSDPEEDQPFEDWGEGFIAMMNHVSDMTGLDRQLFEDSVLSGSSVLISHVNGYEPSFAFRPEILQRRLKCTFEQADELIAYWVIMEATRDMIETFIKWAKVSSPENAIVYFRVMALELLDAEWVDPDDIMEGQSRLASLGNDGEVNEYDFEYEAGYSPTRHYGFHPLGNVNGKDWLTRQSFQFRSLLESIRSVKTLSALGWLGGKAYASRFSNTQASVFWSWYKAKKVNLKGE